jgi:hypothetical protein
MGKEYSSTRDLRMDMEKMLEIIETRAWVPRKKAEKGKVTI